MITFSNLKKFLKNYFPLILFCIVFVGGALITYKDFGTTWDEQDTYQHGGYWLKHTIGRHTDFFSRDLGANNKENLLVLYNHSYPGLLYGLNYLIKGKDILDYKTFHLLNILASLIIFLFSYIIIFNKYSKWYYAILGPIVLLLIPRFIGDIPANPRDGSFAVFYFLAISLIYLLRNKNTKLTLIMLGVAFGIVQSLRVLGITIYAVYVLFSILQILQFDKNNWKKRIVDLIINSTIILLIAFLINVITSPYLGSNFFLHYINSLLYSKSIGQSGSLLIDGVSVPLSKLGLGYLPKMLLITTPLFIIFGFISSLYLGLAKKLKNQLLNILLIALLVNFALYFITNPTIFDGVRHFLFLLPIFGILTSISIIEISQIKKHKYLRYSILLMFCVNIGLVIFQYINLYPYIYIYYNESVGYLSGAYKKYETDYWGASFKEATEWLVKNEINPNKEYLVATCASPNQSTYYFPENVRWAKYTYEADYYICYARNNQNLEVDQSKLIHTIDREGIPLNFIYRLK